MIQGPSQGGTRVADREGHKLNPSPVFSEGRDEGGYFSVFLSNLMSQPRSVQKLISTRMRVHCFLLKEVGSGKGVSGTPLA